MSLDSVGPNGPPSARLGIFIHYKIFSDKFSLYIGINFHCKNFSMVNTKSFGAAISATFFPIRQYVLSHRLKNSSFVIFLFPSRIWDEISYLFCSKFVFCWCCLAILRGRSWFVERFYPRGVLTNQRCPLKQAELVAEPLS